MKGSKIYIAELHRITNCSKTEISLGFGDSFGSYDYDTVLDQQNCLVIKIGSYYVPVFLIKNFIHYASIRHNVSFDGRSAHLPYENHLYSENSPIVVRSDEIVLKNIKPYFDEEESKKHISLRTLKNIQAVFDAQEESLKTNNGATV